MTCAALVDAWMMSRLEAEELTLGTLQFAELNARPERDSKRLELTMKALKSRCVAAESLCVDAQPLADIVDARCGQTRKILAELVSPCLMVLMLTIHEATPRRLQYSQRGVRLVCNVGCRRHRKVEL